MKPVNFDTEQPNVRKRNSLFDYLIVAVLFVLTQPSSPERSHSRRTAV